MPKKTKEQNELDIKKIKKDDLKSTTKKADSKKPAPKKTSSGKAASKSSSTKAVEKSSAKKTVAKNSNKKSTTTSSKKSSTTNKKSTTTKRTTSKKEKSVSIVEYYDLPYRYDETVVRILAQTPNTLFIYWDISDKDRELYKQQFGENFFETSIPVLKIYNDTLNYNFEVEINDFANSWYLKVNDSNCDYRIELLRKAKHNQSQYIYVSSSNEIEIPNNRILFDKNQKMIYFKNVKNNTITSKDISTISFIRNMGKIYNIYDLYKEIYKNENLDNYSNESSSTFF